MVINPLTRGLIIALSDSHLVQDLLLLRLQAADTCRKLPITNATKANLIDLTKPAAPTSIPVFTCTQHPQSHPNLTAGSVATNQIKARMAFAEMVSYKSFDVYYGSNRRNY